MAKQKGIVKLRGSISGITFYKTEDGYLARETGGVDRKRIAKDPAFQRTRENASEFGRCARSSGLLIRAFRGILKKSVDRRLSSRIMQQLFKVIQADQTNARGQRKVGDGELGFLLGFEFNRRSSFMGSFFTPITSTIDRVAGELIVEIGSFVPVEMVMYPSGATHYKIVSAGSALDFDDNSFVSSLSETPPMLLNSVATLAIQHTNTVPVNSVHPLFLVVGLAFYQEVGGTLYALNDGSHNPFCIVKVDV